MNHEIDSYLDQSNWRVKESSNTGYSLQGLNFQLSAKATAKYWMERLYTEDIRKAHLSGDLHIHDLGLLSVYCVGWELKDLLLEGFRGVTGKIEANPARHLRSALGQIVNFFYTLQGEAAGAQALSNFDTLLAPFIFYDGLEYEEVKQCLQEFLFNINIPTRVGFQTPFTNITMDLTVPSYYKDHPVIIGGEYMKETYSDFQDEMDILNRAFAEVMMEGDAKGRVFSFPIPTYNITKDFDWDNKNLDAVWRMTGKYGVPYFSNFINSDMDPEDARSMCCRLRLDNRELRKRGGGLFGANPLTGSVGVVTINMPRIGFLASSKVDFYDRLKKLLDIAEESLVIKRQTLEELTDMGLYPYAKFYLREVKERTGKYWKNHFGTIGLLGLNEACINFLGVKYHIASEEGQAFALEVMDFMRDKISALQEKSGDIYNLEATPGESTTYRFAKKDKELFPDIICANELAYSVGGDPYYTNSSHLPVNYTDDMFEALELQDELQTKYTGGTVMHLFVGEEIPDVNIVKNMVKSIANKFHLPYFTLTPTFSVCPTHGYLSGCQPECWCGEKTEIYSRIVGYLRPVAQWNNGKQAEYDQRKEYKVGQS